MGDNETSYDDAWMFVAGHDADPDSDLMKEGLCAAPAAVRRGGAILPRQRAEDGTCRLCGTQTKLSREHVPPRSAGNSARVEAHTIGDWLDRASIDEIPGGMFEQGGVWGFTLCERCNNATGRLSSSYRSVANAMARLMVDNLPPIEELNQERVTRLLTIRTRMHPGAFVRQVISLMCSLAGPWDVAKRHPELRSAVLDGAVRSWPSSLSLNMLLCAGPYGLTAGPSLHIDTAAKTWRWIAVLAHPPLAFELELATSVGRAPSPGCDIGGFLEVDEAMEGLVDLQVPIGFTNTAFPGDWRSRVQVEQGLDLTGAPDRPGST